MIIAHPAPLAAGGTLDDWQFVVNLLVAVGTVGAVIVSLMLARRASRLRHAEHERDQLVSARQVVAVLRRSSRSDAEAPTSSRVRVVNSGPTTILDVQVKVALHTDHGAPDDAPSTAWRWVWERRDWLDFLEPGGREDLRGGLVPKSSDESDNHDNPVAHERPDSSVIPAWAKDQILLTVTWQDGHGMRWSRTNNQEPTPSGSVGGGAATIG
jgi:hypothetical protein